MGGVSDLSQLELELGPSVSPGQDGRWPESMTLRTDKSQVKPAHCYESHCFKVFSLSFTAKEEEQSIREIKDIKHLY